MTQPPKMLVASGLNLLGTLEELIKLPQLVDPSALHAYEFDCVRDALMTIDAIKWRLEALQFYFETAGVSNG